MIEPYDALLLVSFGGPEGPAEVMPFLRNVTRGRGIPQQRLESVAEHYLRFGGVSPINAQNRELVKAIEEDLARHDLELPVYLGNRNWHPLLADTLQRMREDGVRRAAVLVTAAYSSYSGCRQYREDLAEALTVTGGGAPVLDKLRHYFNHPGFVGPSVDAAAVALAELPAGSELAFVTHSIPVAMNDTSGPAGHAYETQHRAVAELVAAGVEAATGRAAPWALAYCSRSGPAGQPWLEPDVNDHLTVARARGVPGVAMVPIGFVSDHMEVRYDLDTEALATAAGLGLPAARAATVGTDQRFVAAIRQLVLERAAAERGDHPTRPAIGALGPSHDRCPSGCCPNPRGSKPAVCEATP